MATAKTAPTVQIYDHATGETIVREMTAEEIEIREASAAQLAAEKAAADAKAAARQSALAKLAELGLTEEEIAAL